MHTDLQRLEPLETLEPSTAAAGATSRRPDMGANDAPIWRNTKLRFKTAVVVICTLCAVGGIVGARSLGSVRRPAAPVCSTIRNGPTSCVTADGSSVIATLRNEMNIEVCGDFRLELLRYDRYDRRLVDSNQPSWRGCLPANDSWDVRYALRHPGIPKASGGLRPYRYMCVTGYRLFYGRWLETGWACQASDQALVDK